LAEELGLDSDSFAKCLGSRQALEGVLSDVFDSMAVTTSAPTFVFLANGIGTVTRGAVGVERFSSLMQRTLKEANDGEVPQ
jgi:predicted DsbA family dithiol-disulfide isomerase